MENMSFEHNISGSLLPNFRRFCLFVEFPTPVSSLRKFILNIFTVTFFWNYIGQCSKLAILKFRIAK